MKKYLLLALTLICLYGLVAAVCQALSDRPQPVAVTDSTHLVPNDQMEETNHEIIYRLTRRHYNKLEIDDNLSARVYERYLSALDNTRSYFLAADIAELDVYRLQLDDALRQDSLAPAFKIYNRYQQRITERLLFVIDQLERGLDGMRFDQAEELETDREKAPWPASVAEMNELWLKRLKGRVLELKMSGKEMDEISILLLKRYRNQLNRIGLSNADDVFQIYMNALTTTFDPHTNYLSPRSQENFDISMRLSLEGIGAVLQTEDEYTKVVRLIPGGPADKAKQLKAADRIVGVGQGGSGEIVEVVSWRLDEVVQRIRGPKGTVVRLEIIPADAEDAHQTQTITIVRDKVKLEEQAASQSIIELHIQDQVVRLGIIDIPTFYVDFTAQQAGRRDYRSTTRDVRRLLAELAEARVDGIVVDLRDNGGGSLQEANTLTGLFIDTGPIVQVRDANGRVSVLRDPDPDIVYTGPLAVVVNRLSASASEIFAGAIQDYRRGIIIGEQTFGKGTVQALLPLQRGQLKNTSAKFYRISGDSTQHRGVRPDISYPSLYDFDQIGESALKTSLPWDRIKGVHHKVYDNFVALLDRLQNKHQKRMAINPDYAYLQSRIKRLQEKRLDTTVSLNEATRQQEKKEAEQWRLTAENTLRRAKGLAPYVTLKELEEEQKKVKDKPEAKDDPVLVESGYILMDLLGLQRSDVVMQ